MPMSETDKENIKNGLHCRISENKLRTGDNVRNHCRLSGIRAEHSKCNLNRFILENKTNTFPWGHNKTTLVGSTSNCIEMVQARILLERHLR